MTADARANPGPSSISTPQPGGNEPQAAYERQPARKLRLIFTGAGAVVVTAGIAWAVVMLDQPEAPAAASVRPIANAQPDSQVVMASAPPAAAPVPVITEAPRANDPPSPPPAPTLNRADIREVQKRLRAFGFDPGSIDGVPGRQTQIATQHYLEARGQPQMPPTEPQLLEDLRQDSTPPVAHPQQRRRSYDPFQPMKVAGAQITRFFQSVFR